MHGRLGRSHIFALELGPVSQESKTLIIFGTLPRRCVDPQAYRAKPLALVFIRCFCDRLQRESVVLGMLEGGIFALRVALVWLVLDGGALGGFAALSRGA